MFAAVLSDLRGQKLSTAKAAKNRIKSSSAVRQYSNLPFDTRSAAFLYFCARHESPFRKVPMLKRLLSILLAVAFATTLSFADEHHFHQPKLTPQQSGTTQLLISVSPVNSRVVWAAGAGGTFVLTTDGGNHWKAGVVPGAESLQFRDVQGVSDKVAYLMSIGDNPTDFRIYKTGDGGATWTIEFTNE